MSLPPSSWSTYPLKTFVVRVTLYGREGNRVTGREGFGTRRIEQFDPHSPQHLGRRLQIANRDKGSGIPVLRKYGPNWYYTSPQPFFRHPEFCSLSLQLSTIYFCSQTHTCSLMILQIYWAFLFPLWYLSCSQWSPLREFGRRLHSLSL